MNMKLFRDLAASMALIGAACFLMGGCASQPPMTNAERWYGSGFRDVAVPSDEAIKQHGSSRDLGSTSQAEAWNAAITVAMQRGPVVRADEARKLIVAPPHILLFEARGHSLILYCSYMDELHYNSKNPREELFRVKPEEKHQLVEEVLNAIETQASVHGRWKWLR